MPDKATFLKLMEDASAFSDEYRRANIDPAHRRADNAYHSILENESDYQERKRSSLFIPKTRINTDKWARVIASAYYTSDDIVTLTNTLEPDGARFTNEVVNIRLEKHMPTFMVIANGAHAHCKYGNAIGKTGWEFSTQKFTETGLDGSTVTYEAPVKDGPFMEVIPFENIQYDFRVISANPVQDSPFWRHWIPMYVTDVEDKYRSKEWKKPKAQDWKTIKINSSTDTVRKARQGKMQDPQAQSFGSAGNDSAYHQIWVVENYFRIGGTDWTFLSIGDEHILTDWERTVDKFVHRRRPFAMSQFGPEAFRSYSDGIPEQMRHLQAETNAIRNQRRDNVSIVLNRGHYVRRGSGVQIQSLLSPRAGMVTLGDDIGEDSIRPMDVMDVTASAYREEEMTARDIEELSGHSQNTLGVASSDRQSATEAAIKASASGEKEAFIIKSFTDSFMMPLMEMFVANVVEMENDQGVLNDASLATGLPPDPALLVGCEVTLNAGMGSTNKELQSMRIGQALDKAVQLAPIDPAFAMAARELFRDLLPLMGRKNVDRYLPRQNQAVPSNAGGVAPAAPSPPGPAALPPAPGMSQASAPGNLGGFASGLLQ